MAYTDYTSVMQATAMIPKELLVTPLHAWTLFITILAASCGILWFLTAPSRRDQRLGYSPDPARRRNPRRKQQPTAQRRPRARVPQHALGKA